MEDYSGRQLTFEHDKLSALAGLTDAFGQNMPGNVQAAGL
jgi:hypothetical protein